MPGAYGCEGDIVGIAITGHHSHCHAMVLWAFGVAFHTKYSDISILFELFQGFYVLTRSYIAQIVHIED